MSLCAWGIFFVWHVSPHIYSFSSFWRSLGRFFFLSVLCSFLLHSYPFPSCLLFSSFFIHTCWYKHFPFSVHEVRSFFFLSAEWKLTSFRVDPWSQAPMCNNSYKRRRKISKKHRQGVERETLSNMDLELQTQESQVGTLAFYVCMFMAIARTQRNSYTATKTADSSGHRFHCSVSSFLTTHSPMSKLWMSDPPLQSHS